MKIELSYIILAVMALILVYRDEMVAATVLIGTMQIALAIERKELR